MTRDERTVLDVLVDEFRDFRQGDAKWKAQVDERLRSVEKFVTSEQAVDERDQARGVSRRAYIASIIAAAGTGVTVILFILTRLLPGV